MHRRLGHRPCRRRGDGVLQVGYAEKRVRGLAAGSRPDQNVMALEARRLEAVVLEQQGLKLAFQFDQGGAGPG